MKKYEKPAIEELHIGAIKLLSGSNINDVVGGGPQFAPGKKGSGDDYDEDNGFSEGW